MNPFRSLFVVLIMSAAAALAQNLNQLQSLTSAYALQRSTLTSAGEAQVKAPRERYVAALAAAQKVALSATRTADLAAISAEMTAVASGSLPEAAPPDLPRALLPDRRTLVAAFVGAERMVAPRLRELAITYQRSLVALEEVARRGKDQALLDAIAAEKQRAFSEVESTGGGQKNRNIVENGDFTRGTDGAPPPGWTRVHTWKEVPDAMLVSEGREKFLRFRRLEAIQQANLKPEKLLPAPARAKFAEVTFRMRVEGIVKGKDYDVWPGVHISARDARDESLAKEEAVVKENCGWKRMNARVKLPDGTKSLTVSLGPFSAAGIIDFDDVAVEFK